MALGKRQRRQAARMGVLLRTEREFWDKGIELVAGVDEVGVGPLAGPVVAAAVIVSPDMRLREIDDSKKLRPAVREELADKIREQAVSFGIGIADVEEIDRINIYQAALAAMRRAVEGLTVAPQHLVVDARTVPGVDLPQTSMIKGDAKSYSIAAASIVAKVARDQMMLELDAAYPEYGFASHMGYGTRRHLDAIEEHGPCPAHRRSFAPVSQLRLL